MAKNYWKIHFISSVKIKVEYTNYKAYEILKKNENLTNLLFTRRQCSPFQLYPVKDKKSLDNFFVVMGHWSDEDECWDLISALKKIK